VDTVLRTATRSEAILSHLRYLTENTAGVAPDHPVVFYQPNSSADPRVSPAERRANDTSFCTAHAPYTDAERAAIDLETFLTGDRFAELCPGAGTDAKVMVVRMAGRLDVTACLPFHPERATSPDEYRQLVRHAEHTVRGFLDTTYGVDIELSLNTKDASAGGAYLAPFGTSLGKGDCGLVGRGNKANGVIPAVRCTSVEALSGKNPIHHTGKLYTLAAARIADRLHAEFGLANEVVLMSRNGHLLREPAFVGVRLSPGGDHPSSTQVRDIADDVLSNLDILSKWLLETSAVDRFRNPQLVLGG
jgi:S-adenosylmethionine synthetase